MQHDGTSRVITEEMVERGAAALWDAHGTTNSDFADPDERQAAWANACGDVEAVLRGALGWELG